MSIVAYLPVLIVVLSNTFYHVTAKSTPTTVPPFASLTVTYAIGLAASFILHLFTSKSANPLIDYQHIHWSAVVLGLAIVGLEAGNLLLYKSGWNISTGSLVCSVTLAVILILVGSLFFRESLSPSKLAGIGLCLAGLYFINK